MILYGDSLEIFTPSSFPWTKTLKGWSDVGSSYLSEGNSMLNFFQNMVSTGGVLFSAGNPYGTTTYDARIEQGALQPSSYSFGILQKE